MYTFVYVFSSSKIMVADIAEYRKRLMEPPAAARGYTRWWWYGGAVTREEIDRQLGLMHAANLGGVEVALIYPLQMDGGGVTNRHFGSPEFLELLRYASNQCRELGMAFDVTLGSGWPFGGPFITEDMAPNLLIPYSHLCSGPSVFSFDYTGAFAGDPVCAVMGRVERGQLVTESLRDITEKLERTWIYSWPYGYAFRDLEIPPGEWQVTLFVSGRYRQQVGKAMPGMEGYAMDHCRRDVAELYFEHLGAVILHSLGSENVRSVFCDSIELEGNNWTPSLLEEFAKRRGYQLQPYLPLLWNQGHGAADVRHDFYQTMSELTIENFFDPLTAWCEARGVQSRVQAHGTWGDILRAYGSAHIPEGETFGEGDVYEVNTVHRRLASSAAHVYDRPLVSNESFTWLRMPRFLVNLEMIKLAADAIFLDGMNHIINHGYSYSPEAAGEPGWVFYASSMISHTNTWWPFYADVSQYIHRVSAMLQRGRSVAEVGIYLPQHDIWAQNPMAELHMSMRLESHFGRDALTAVQKAGYWFDFLNDDALTKLGSSSTQGLLLHGNTYRTLLLIGVERVPESVAESLADFVRQGGTLIAVETIPHLGCGFRNSEAKARRVQELMQPLFSDEWGVWHSVGSGRTIRVADRDEGLLQALHQAQTPDCCVRSPQSTVGYVHRRDGEEEIFFLANVSRERAPVEAAFAAVPSGCVLLDPWTGTIFQPQAVTREGRTTTLRLTLPAGGSCFAVFTPVLGLPVPAGLPTRETAVTLPADWTLTLPSLGQPWNIGELRTWETLPESRYFCGQGTYTNHFTLASKKDGRYWLRFSAVHEAADVWINGIRAGAVIKRPYEVDITRCVREGRNEVEVRVVNLWFNRCLDHDLAEPTAKATYSEYWPHFTSIIDEWRATRLYTDLERDMIDELQPSGLAGEVTVVWEGSSSCE